MNELTIIELGVKNHKEFGDLSTYTINGKPYFKGIEIAERLGYAQPSKAIWQHCKHSIKATLGAPFQNGKVVKTQTNLIPLGDVVRLIIKSKLPKAQQFECWVMDEVVPSILLTGKYETEYVTKEYFSQVISNVNLTVSRIQKDRNNIQKDLNNIQKELNIYKRLYNTKNGHSMDIVSQRLGTTSNEINGILIGKGIFKRKQHRNGKYLLTEPYLYLLHDGYCNQYTYEQNGVSITELGWTEKGIHFIKTILDQLETE